MSAVALICEPLRPTLLVWKQTYLCRGCLIEKWNNIIHILQRIWWSAHSENRKLKNTKWNYLSSSLSKKDMKESFQSLSSLTFMLRRERNIRINNFYQRCEWIRGQRWCKNLCTDVAWESAGACVLQQVISLAVFSTVLDVQRQLSSRVCALYITKELISMSEETSTEDSEYLTTSRRPWLEVLIS